MPSVSGVSDGKELYGGANIMLMDVGGSTAQSMYGASGEVLYTWSVTWDDRGFTGDGRFTITEESGVTYWRVPTQYAIVEFRDMNNISNALLNGQGLPIAQALVESFGLLGCATYHSTT